MQRHMENTAAVLDFLTKSKAVDWVLHPSLRSHRISSWPSGCCRGGAGSIISCGIRSGRASGAEIHRGAAARQPSRQCRRRQDPGHPSGQHHAPADGRGATQGRGLGEELVRLSVGIEAAATSSTIWRRRCAPRRGRERCSSSSTTRRHLPPPAARFRPRAAARSLRARRRARSHGLGAAGAMDRIAASPCWRRTCPAMDARTVNRSPPSAPWRIGRQR